MAVEMLLLVIASLAAIAGAILLFRSSRQEDYRARMLTRLPQPARHTDLPESRSGAEQPIEQLLTHLLGRAGYTPAPWHGWALLIGIALSAILGLELFGFTGTVLLPLGIVALLYLALITVGARRRRRITAQLPTFLDHVIRSVRAGNSIEQGLVAAVEESDGPIREVFERVVRQVQLGVHLDEAVDQAAMTYRLQELDLLQAAISVNLRYGGAIREILESVITALRQREAAHRELRAMTGETRLSAWVLAVLPISLAVYIVSMNPQYFMLMWNEENGRMVMLAAGALQGLGVFIIWRMLRSI